MKKNYDFLFDKRVRSSRCICAIVSLMIITNCILHLDLPHVVSLKGRRSITNRIKDRLGHYNVSVLDVSGEYPKEADIAFVFISPDAMSSAQYRQSIESMLHSKFPELMPEVEYELF